MVKIFRLLHVIHVTEPIPRVVLQKIGLSSGFPCSEFLLLHFPDYVGVLLNTCFYPYITEQRRLGMDGYFLLRDATRFLLLKWIEPSLTSCAPHTVQQVCIPTAILKVDVLCQAKSGLGKTAVFVLTTLQHIEPVPGECSILVMCHTRELAYQIKNEYARFSKYLPDVKTAVFYGGTPMQKDIEILSSKDTYPNIVVGTPGRLNALVRDKKLSLRNVKAFVLDECDKMLDQRGQFARAF